MIFLIKALTIFKKNFTYISKVVKELTQDDRTGTYRIFYKN